MFRLKYQYRVHLQNDLEVGLLVRINIRVWNVAMFGRHTPSRRKHHHRCKGETVIHAEHLLVATRIEPRFVPFQPTIGARLGLVSLFSVQ